MGHRLGNRLDKLEARQTDGVDHEKFARQRAKHERIQRLAKENPETVTAYLDAEDEVLIAIEEARVRGEDPEDASEVLAAQRALERIERRLLGEDAAGPI